MRMRKYALFALAGACFAWSSLLAQPAAPASSTPNEQRVARPLYTDLKTALKHPRQVYRLQLKGQARWPKQLAQFSNLRELDLSRGTLTDIPGELGLLSHLEVLDLSHNQLSQLPAQLGQLIHLRELRLTANQ